MAFLARPLTMKTVLKTTLDRFGYSLVRAPLSLVRNPHDQISLFDTIVAHWIGKLNPFYFVQVGAYDGEDNDFLARYIPHHDLRGVLAEPQPTPFERLRRRYEAHPHLTLRNVAVSTVAGRRTLYTVEPMPDLPDWVGQIASFDRDIVVKHEAWAPGLTRHVRATEVACVPLDDLIEGARLERIDLVQIDTEGFDFEVVKMIDVERWRPKVIHYEHAHLSKQDTQDCLAYLLDHGYCLAVEGMDTTAYLRV